MKNTDSTFDQLLPLALMLWLVGSYLTGIVSAIVGAKWSLLTLNLLFPPASIINGTGIWFGWW